MRAEKAALIFKYTPPEHTLRWELCDACGKEILPSDDRVVAPHDTAPVHAKCLGERLCQISFLISLMFSEKPHHGRQADPIIT